MEGMDTKIYGMGKEGVTEGGGQGRMAHIEGNLPPKREPGRGHLLSLLSLAAISPSEERSICQAE